jgi:hypothetical protein
MPHPEDLVLLTPSVPRCRPHGTSADTAPRMTLQGARKVFVIAKPNSPPIQQKVAGFLLEAARAKGHTLVDVPAEADLVLTAQVDFFSVSHATVETATARSKTVGTFSLVGGGGGWGLSSYTTIAQVPIVRTEEHALAKVRIDAFGLAGKDASLSYVWNGELQTTEENFRDAPSDCIARLFERIGGADGLE